MSARTVLSLSLAALLAAPALAEDKTLKPTRAWVGVHKDEKVKKLAPEAGFLTDAKSFAKLWKAWRPEEKVPEVDFRKEFVVVATAGGPNRPNVSGVLDDRGDLKIRAISTLIGGPGFGYAFATFPRAGVKTVGGKPLDKK